MQVYNLCIKYEATGIEVGAMVTGPNQLVSYLQGAFDDYLDQEQFWVIGLDGNNQPLFRRRITIGVVNTTNIQPRETFRPAILAGCVSIIVAHNHPTGNLRPSEDDITTTVSLVEAGKILCIPVLDHLIVDGVGNGYSLKGNYPEIFK